MAEILLETNKGIIFEKTTTAKRCKVNAKNNDGGYMSFLSYTKPRRFRIQSARRLPFCISRYEGSAVVSACPVAGVSVKIPFGLPTPSPLMIAGSLSEDEDDLSPAFYRYNLRGQMTEAVSNGSTLTNVSKTNELCAFFL